MHAAGGQTDRQESERKRELIPTLTDPFTGVGGWRRRRRKE